MKPPAVSAGTIGLGSFAATVVAAVVVGITLGLEIAVLVIAGASLLAVITLFWFSVRNLSGDTPLTIDEALGMGAPTAAEEQKRSVLRALKDLEFERSVGKISEEDYREFSQRYRAEAKRLIAAVDESLGPVQALAEKLATERLITAGLLDKDSKPAAGPASPAPSAEAPDAAAASEPAADETTLDSEPEPAAHRACPGCQTENDPDAAFCKRCGKALEVARNESAPAQVVEEEVP